MARADGIVPIVKVAPKHIAAAIRQVQVAMDLTDYQAHVNVAAHLGNDLTLPEQCYAWMMAAMLIAATTEIDSMALRALQTSIWKGEQDVLFW